MATALSKVKGFLLGVYADPRVMTNIPEPNADCAFS
jgi:hypothetical protein